MDTLWAAIKTDWHQEARCRTANPTIFFPQQENDVSLTRVKRAYCDLCPVRDKCLNSALVNRDTGYWGGTSTEQRRALSRTRSRVKCPICLTTETVIYVTAHEVCIACGASWKSDRRPAERQSPSPVTA